MQLQTAADATGLQISASVSREAAGSGSTYMVKWLHSARGAVRSLETRIDLVDVLTHLLEQSVLHFRPPGLQRPTKQPQSVEAFLPKRVPA